MADKQSITKHPLYLVWWMMNDRCTNPGNKSFQHYGARGIRVCDRWASSFEDFLADMGPRPLKHEIERKDNEGHYDPDNCVWATRMTQAANKRNNRLVAYLGETLHLNEWARRTGIRAATLRFRIESGWPLDIALTKQVGSPHQVKPVLEVKVPAICRRCFSTFMVHPYRIQKARYCSYDCYHSSMRGHRPGFTQQ